MELTHTLRCPPHLKPSLFAETRSRTGEPPMHERWPLARYEIAPGTQHYAMTTMGGMYHPVLRAIAPPRCVGAIVRVPVGMVMQWGQDVACGALTLGCSLGALLLGRRAFAGALMQEHGYQMCVLAMTVIVCGLVDAVAVTVICLSAA